MKKIFVIALVALLFAPAAFAQEKPVAQFTIVDTMPAPAAPAPAPVTPVAETAAPVAVAAEAPAPVAPVAQPPIAQTPAPGIVEELTDGITASKSFKYTLDPAHTQVMFAVSHLGFSFSHGRFDKFDGSFTFNAAQPETSEIEATIDINSLDMGSAEWDKHLKSADFFNAEKFPTMTFKSTKIEKTGEKTGTVTGDLTLMGVTKPVTLEVRYNNSGVHPYNRNHIAGFSATGLIKRSDFGMKGGLPAVGDDVAIMIEVEGNRRDFDDINKK